MVIAVHICVYCRKCISVLPSFCRVWIVFDYYFLLLFFYEIKNGSENERESRFHLVCDTVCCYECWYQRSQHRQDDDKWIVCCRLCTVAILYCSVIFLHFKIKIVTSNESTTAESLVLQCECFNRMKACKWKKKPEKNEIYETNNE